MTSQKTDLVTGGAGSIGSPLCDRLVGDGWSVTVLGNLSSGSMDNLASESLQKKRETIVGDTANRYDVEIAIDGADRSVSTFLLTSKFVWS